jgi:hypothetical protein
MQQAEVKTEAETMTQMNQAQDGFLGFATLKVMSFSSRYFPPKN